MRGSRGEASLGDAFLVGSRGTVAHCQGVCNGAGAGNWPGAVHWSTVVVCVLPGSACRCLSPPMNRDWMEDDDDEVLDDSDEGLDDSDAWETEEEETDIEE